jgi:glycosyltransferase involved in cell wall biosynthesis
VTTLRVGLFSECYRPIQNGIVASVDALALALRSRGHAAIVVTPEMPGYRDVAADVVRVPSLPLPTRTAYRLTVPYLPLGALGALSIAHTHSPFVTGWLGARAAKRAGIPLVFTYHTQLEAYAHYVPFEMHATRSAATQLTRAYANSADAVIVPTAAMERRLRELGVRTRIAVVPSGIDVAQFARGRRSAAMRARLGARDDDALILNVGRLGREKNVELALEAFARLDHPRARLAVVGDGAYRDALERTAARLGVAARTTFAREFARADLPDAYASCDAFVFPSRSETQGLVLVEALAAGARVVAVDTPQTRDVLGDAGTLVPADREALAAALRRVLAEGRGEPGRGAAVAARFDGDRLGEEVIALYRELVTGVPERALAAAR